MTYAPNPFGKYRLVLENYRAIKKADVTLDGIAVVAGINACGKSTLSKVLYGTFDCSICFISFARAPFEAKYKKIDEELFRYLRYFCEETQEWYVCSVIATRSKSGRLVFSESSAFQNIVGSIGKIRDRINSKDALTLEDKRRIRRMFRYFLGEDVVRERRDEISDESSDFEWKRFATEILSEFENKIVSERDEIERKIETRDLNVYKKSLVKLFDEKLFDSKTNFRVFDEDIVVNDDKRNTLETIPGVENVFYYDTPLFDFRGTAAPTKSYYGEIRAALNDVDAPTVKSPQIDEINRELERIVGGNVRAIKVRAGLANFLYRREDGEKYSLEDCANGIKGLGLLQLLLNKGVLTNKTVVFLDEPEVYLHPAWIVEYARMLVLINKLLGTRFFVATHNPDMVGAIRFISEKEGTLGTTRFYLAEDEPDADYRYVFNEVVDDDKNIDPIYKSFGIALRKIDRYSAPDDEEAE